MRDKVDSLSVFFPFYNEEGNIENVVRKADGIAREVAKQYEIIIVDDGSKDGTGEIAKRLTEENPNWRLVSHDVNRGYGGALKSGLYSCRYDLVTFNDGDGQFDFSEIGIFLDNLPNADLVIGYRKKRSEGGIRVINQKLYHLLILVLFGVHFRDLDCGFKLLRKKVLDSIPHLESEGALVSAELLILAKRKGFRIVEVPVSHYPRIYGKPTGANLRVILKMFWEVYKFWRRLNKS